MPAAALGDALQCAAAPETPDAAGPQQQQQQPPLPALAFAPCAATEPVRRVVSILQTQIAALEKQAKMKAKPSKDQNSQQPVGKCDDVLPLLEFAWDLIKQVMGIAVLSENEAKKQAKKDSASRKAQDLNLVHQVILVWTCIERIKANRASFLSDAAETNSISQEDMEAVDKICPELTRNPDAEEDESSFRDRTMDIAKHILAIIEGDSSEVFGTTYARIKDAVSNVYESGYFDNPRESAVEDVERPDATIGEDAVENPERQTVPPHSAPMAPVNPPPPAPQAVPTPAFSMLPPRPPPVTLQQVEHAYFAQQYGHQHQPVVPEVFGPQSFIFIQDSELDSADISQQPTPRPASPAAIPSQTFTNQSFTIPQHFPPDMAPNPHIPINEMAPPVHFPANVNDVTAIANYSAANPPPPIPMPPSHPNVPPHMTVPAGQVVNHPHPLQQRLPSPSFQQPIPFKPQPTHPVDPAVAQTQSENVQVENKPSTPVEQERDWLDSSPIENPTEPLEIDEWNPETAPDSSAQTNGQTDKFRHRGRGRGSGNFRGRGGYQNGRSGSYFRNNENGQPNNTVNGGNYENNYRENRNEGNRYDNYQGNYRGRGANGRGNARQNGGTRMPRNGQSRGNGGSRPQYARKPTSSNNHFDTRNGVDSNNKPTYAH